MLEKIRKYIDSNGLLSENDRLLVGLSGGADSVCLLTVLQELGYDVVCVHCNFHLRGDESQRDEAFARSLCERKGVRLIVKDFDTTAHAREHGVSIEMAARDLRYCLFHELLQTEKLTKICVGHHSDDNIETMLINLLRGTGLKGLCGIQPKNGVVVRPLLSCSKAEILAYLKEKGESYVTDSSNLEADVVRNKVRLELLPLMEQISPAARHNLLTTLQNLNEEAKMYEETMTDFTEHFSYQEDDILFINKARVRTCASPVALLHWMLAPMGFNRSQLFQMLETMDHVGRVFESPTHRLLVDREWLMVEERSDDDFQSIPIDLRQEEGQVDIGNGKHIRWRIIEYRPNVIQRSPNHAYLDRLKAASTLWVRRVRKNDRFEPFGMRGTKLVSDFLTDLKLSRFDKERQLVVESFGEIAWVVGRRSSDRFKATDDTRHVVELLLSN